MNVLLKSILRATAAVGVAFLVLAAIFAIRSWLRGDEVSMTSYLQKWDIFLVALVLYCVYLAVGHAVDKGRK